MPPVFVGEGLGVADRPGDGLDVGEEPPLGRLLGVDPADGAGLVFWCCPDPVLLLWPGLAELWFPVSLDPRIGSAGWPVTRVAGGAFPEPTGAAATGSGPMARSEVAGRPRFTETVTIRA